MKDTGEDRAFFKDTAHGQESEVKGKCEDSEQSAPSAVKTTIAATPSPRKVEQKDDLESLADSLHQATAIHGRGQNSSEGTRKQEDFEIDNLKEESKLEASEMEDSRRRSARQRTSQYSSAVINSQIKGNTFKFNFF